MARRRKLPLLAVDGYNLLHATPRYAALVREGVGGRSGASRASLPSDPMTRADRAYNLSSDPYEGAREAMVADVAAYAQGDYDAVLVFDGANNVSDARPDTSRAGVRVVFSRTGQSADAVIERLVTQAKEEGREAVVVTSDSTIRATVHGDHVSFLSSDLIARDLGVMNAGIEQEREERSYARLRVSDRLDPETRAKLDALRGRRS